MKFISKNLSSIAILCAGIRSVVFKTVFVSVGKDSQMFALFDLLSESNEKRKCVCDCFRLVVLLCFPYNKV